LRMEGGKGDKESAERSRPPLRLQRRGLAREAKKKISEAKEKNRSEKIEFSIIRRC